MFPTAGFVWFPKELYHPIAGFVCLPKELSRPIAGFVCLPKELYCLIAGFVHLQKELYCPIAGFVCLLKELFCPITGFDSQWSCFAPLLAFFDSHTTSRFRCCFLDTQDTNYQKTYKNVWNKYFVNAQKVEPGSCCKIVKNHYVKIDNSPHLHRYRADGQQEISRELLWSITIHNIHVTVPRLSLFINYCQFSNFWCNKYIKRITVTVCVN